MAAIFIHLSDIHFGQEKDGGSFTVNEDAKEQLLIDAAAEMSRLGVSATGVILTGDISYSAKYEEYVQAGKWLDRLAKRVGCNRLDIQMVPGNHDISRDALTRVTKMHLEDIRTKGDIVLDTLLDDSTQREVLYERFAAYRQFSEGYGCELDVGGSYSADVQVNLAPGRSLRFVRINTALICSQKDDKGKLILGARQRVIRATDGEELVVLMHHPLSWLQDSDDAARYFARSARVIISGHEHFPSLNISSVEDGSDLLMLAAGATAPERVVDGYSYKYNILTFEWDESDDALAVTVNPRGWNSEKKRFERDVAFLEEGCGRCVLGSPYFRRGAKSGTPCSEVIVDHPHTKAVANPVTGSEGVDFSMDDEVRLIRLRFFRDLPEESRRQILVDLGVIPEDLTDHLDHVVEKRLFAKLITQRRIKELSIEIEAKISKINQGD